MQLRLVLCVVGLAAIAHGQFKVAKCNPKVIDAIHNFWAKKGTPQKFFDKIGVTWKVYKTTNSGRYTGVQCVTYTPLGNGVLSINSDGVLRNITASQKDGILTIEGDDDTRLLVISTDKIIASYHCTADGPDFCKEQGDAGFIVSPTATKKDIAHAEKVQSSFGFKLTKVFSC